MSKKSFYNFQLSILNSQFLNSQFSIPYCYLYLPSVMSSRIER